LGRGSASSRFASSSGGAFVSVPLDALDDIDLLDVALEAVSGGAPERQPSI
jgi:hypothetical protein